ncbi:hypothetical protein MAR_015141 [Mya arenaria]|uniref:Uncharacterized protein n=1 Tax=Mya arenaria TaxID=6604 RepID=A0ABY7FHW6_MYAAR|nr:hypothetical protein MAR_015141 [Mya arenaria]
MCCVAGCGAISFRAHAFEAHVLGIFNEEQIVTEKVTMQHLTVLNIQAMQLSLVNFIDLAGQIRADKVQFNNRSKASVEALCNALKVPYPEVLSLSLISTPGLLFHWRAQIVICSLLNQSKVGDLRKAFPTVECLENPMAWDSHFHADRTAERAQMGVDDLQALVNSAPCTPSLKVNVTGGVAVFCDMNSYPTQLEQGVVIAVGIHPKHAAKLTEKDWFTFEAALALSGVSALGEVGSDYTAQPSTWRIQHAVLHRALRYLRLDHVLVGQSQCWDDMLQLLFQLKGCIPTEQRIHLHCFSGSQYAVDQWSSHFPNIHFVYTTSFLNAGENAIQALQNKDESLEPKNKRKKFSKTTDQKSDKLTRNLTKQNLSQNKNIQFLPQEHIPIDVTTIPSTDDADFNADETTVEEITVIAAQSAYSYQACDKLKTRRSWTMGLAQPATTSPLQKLISPLPYFTSHEEITTSMK